VDKAANPECKSLMMKSRDHYYPNGPQQAVSLDQHGGIDTLGQ